MTNAYKELKDKQQKEFNDFPLFFAFGKEQFDEGMKKLGLKPTDTAKVYSFGFGGFYRKTDADALKEMLERHDTELKSSIKEDRTGEGFIYDMFSYELANHEYGYTGELDDTLEALNLTLDEIYAYDNLTNGLENARRDCK